MFEKLSVKITDILESNGVIQKSGRNLCAYGLRQIFSSLLNVITMLLIGFAMGMVIPALAFTLGYIPIRVYAGGYHASTPKRCWAVSAVMLFAVLCVLKYMPELYNNYLTVLSLIACIVIIMLSPVEDANKPLDKKEIKVYHTRTVITVCIEIAAAVFLYVLKLNDVLAAVEMAWLALCIILVIGKIKNVFIKKNPKEA